MEQPIPDGCIEVVYKNTEMPVIFYFSEIHTYKLPHMTSTDALTIIWEDRSMAIPRENILNWVIRKNSPEYRMKLADWLTDQHKKGHPEKHNFRCKGCIEDERKGIILHVVDGQPVLPVSHISPPRPRNPHFPPRSTPWPGTPLS